MRQSQSLIFKDEIAICIYNISPPRYLFSVLLLFAVFHISKYSFLDFLAPRPIFYCNYHSLPHPKGSGRPPPPHSAHSALVAGNKTECVEKTGHKRRPTKNNFSWGPALFNRGWRKSNSKFSHDTTQSRTQDSS